VSKRFVQYTCANSKPRRFSQSARHSRQYCSRMGTPCPELGRSRAGVMSASRNNMRFQLDGGLRHLMKSLGKPNSFAAWAVISRPRPSPHRTSTLARASRQRSAYQEAKETLRSRGLFGNPEAESGIPARPQFSWQRPSNSAMAACESPNRASVKSRSVAWNPAEAACLPNTYQNCV